MANPPVSLRERLAQVGHVLAAREAPHAAALESARKRAEELRAEIARGLDGYRQAIHAAGAPHLEVQLGPLRTDDKHVRAVEFEVSRGRTRAIVTVKSRGEVTLVGPFRTGKTEGPCKTFPFDAESELHEALADFLAQFLEEGATP
jgi:hypothetical protein